MKRINQAVRKQTEKGLGVVPGQVAAGPEGKGKKLRSAALTLLILSALGNCTYAADTATGAGNGVAYGTGSNAPKAENVAIGKGAGISYSNGASNATGDIVVGNGANINNYASQGGSIAIGKNAKVENMAGGGEASFAFGQTTYSGSWFSSPRIPADPTKVVGSIAMLLATIVLLFVFDWRMGAACLLAAAVSIGAMFSMMGGKNAKLMAEYQAAQDVMSKAGTEYVRGIPVVKVFQQTVYSFRAFKQAIEDYSAKAEHYQADVCQVPQALNLTATEGAFVFLVPVALLIAPGALKGGNFAGFLTDFVFYAVFSAVISTALARVMFAASGTMMASTALGRINQVMSAPTIKITDKPQTPKDNSVVFKDVSFTYEGSDLPALDHVSFRVEPGQTVALVGPSGGGKTTAASLIPRFWDVSSGAVEVGGVDVRQTDPHMLMDNIAFVFQNTHLFKASILENVRASRPDASREEVLKALSAAQCDDIIEKLPNGIDTIIGTEGTYLSGGEQQRVALARAILKDAPIVVLDEATAFADPENEALIQKAFVKLTEGRTVIMIAHRLSTVVGADRIIVLDSGHVEEQGTHAQLLAANGLYARMWTDYRKAVNWKISSESEVG